MYEIVTFGGNCILAKKVDDGPFVNVAHFDEFSRDEKKDQILKVALEIRDILNAGVETEGEADDVVEVYNADGSFAGFEKTD